MPEPTEAWIWEPTCQLRWQWTPHGRVLKQLFVGRKVADIGGISVATVDAAEEWRTVPDIDT